MGWEPDRSWMEEEELPCRADPEAWHPNISPDCHRKPTAKAQAVLDGIKARCQPCPVRLQCLEYGMGEPWGIWGGTDGYERYQIRRAMYAAAERWPKSRRLELGRRVHELRPPGDEAQQAPWGTTIRLTGLPQRLAMELRDEYMAWRKAQDEAREKSPIPPMKTDEPQWPAGPSARHAWVRMEGKIKAAWYVAHSPDRRNILVRVESGRLNTTTWMPADRVRLHYPQPVQIREMKAARNVHNHTTAA